MAVKAFREVGDCGCSESRAGTRMRELVRSLQEEVQHARQLIDELTGGGAANGVMPRGRPAPTRSPGGNEWIRPS
jgi:hypothetical protein